jgi:hypothetical protein
LKKAWPDVRKTKVKRSYWYETARGCMAWYLIGWRQYR